MKRQKNLKVPKKFVRFILSLLVSCFVAIVVLATEDRTLTPSFAKSVEEDGSIALLSNQLNDDLSALYTDAIDKANSSITLIVYSLLDKAIIKSLNRAALKGVRVKIICDAKTSPGIDSKLNPNIDLMRRFGPGLMHLKILVIDRAQVFLGSANMTYESLHLHGNLVMSLKDAQVADMIQKKANTLTIDTLSCAFPLPPFTVGGQRLTLTFLPDKNGVEEVKNLLQSAKKTIKIAMFTWTRHDFAEELIAAKKRGVKSQVVIDNTAGKGAGAAVYKILQLQGINVFLSEPGPLLHHKFAYIDQKILINGSANWTKAAFTQNDDCFLILYNLTASQKQTMDKLFKKILNETVH